LLSAILGAKSINGEVSNGAIKDRLSSRGTGSSFGSMVLSFGIWFCISSAVDSVLLEVENQKYFECPYGMMVD
jgi:hypothetical protein